MAKGFYQLVVGSILNMVQRAAGGGPLNYILR